MVRLTASQLYARTEWSNRRLAEIADALAESASGSVLRPFVAAESAQAIWDGLDPARQRAVIDALAAITLRPAGRGARVFDPATVSIEPRQPAA